jgi:hypothetical protein
VTWRLLALLAATSLAACTPREARPWDQPDAATAVPPPMPPIRGSSPAPDVSAASSAVDPDVPLMPVRVGGAWVRCYGHFKPSGDPKKDVTRLGLMCGPSNGMSKQAELAGDVDARGRSSEERIEAKRGVCYRVIAVGDAGVGVLRATVRTSRGSAIADERGPDSWPIVQPDRPLCALDDDHWTLEVRAEKGAGRFAAEVWVLSTEP